MNNKSILKGKSNYHHIEPPDLLCFGYQSKIYRDDAKALEFDRETHLIPAPYGHKDLISRYDVRATLESAPCETHDNYMNRLNYLPPAEQEAEKLAEKERYYSLYINEVEEELYKEELLKREQAGTQVSFRYDDIGPKESAEAQEPEETDTTPFTPSVKLDLPVDMEIPSTLKLNQIIEKTAKFISSQGPQMEILLKTKQASNPQFNFLNHDGQYFAYYRHILGMMKAGTYPWPEVIDKSEENSQDSEEFKVNGTTEPLVAPSSVAIIIPKMTFKPSADCAYTQLISKITKAPIAEIKKQKLQEIESQKNGGSVAPTDIIRKSSGLMGLVHYSSDSDSEEEEANVITYTGLIPPTDLQVVIDKTAAYVAKNGVEFEETLRKKNDVRFQFLDKLNEFNHYYLFKVNEIRGTVPPPAPVIIQKPKEEVELPKAPPAPVCFSIKPKEEKSQLKPTILQAGSDDEIKEKPLSAPTPPRISNITSVEEELEMQVDAMNAEREEKFAKEKLSDKLMSAAREKLGMLPKEKMLQIERKKKALLFINQIKGPNGNSSNGGGSKEDEIINLTHYGDDSDDSVRSIPVATSSTAVSQSVSRRSRSRKRSSSSTRSSFSSSRSRSRSHKRSKRKKSKSHRSKKKYRKKSRSRSRSYSSTHKRDRHDRRY